jgi:hypothetical protein
MHDGTRAALFAAGAKNHCVVHSLMNAQAFIAREAFRREETERRFDL